MRQTSIGSLCLGKQCMPWITVQRKTNRSQLWNLGTWQSTEPRGHRGAATRYGTHYGGIVQLQYACCWRSPRRSGQRAAAAAAAGSSPNPSSLAVFQPSGTAQPQSSSRARLNLSPWPSMVDEVTIRKKPRSPHGSPHELRTILHAGDGQGEEGCERGAVRAARGRLSAPRPPLLHCHARGPPGGRPEGVRVPRHKQPCEQRREQPRRLRAGWLTSTRCRPPGPSQRRSRCG